VGCCPPCARMQVFDVVQIQSPLLQDLCLDTSAVLIDDQAALASLIEDGQGGDNWWSSYFLLVFASFF